MKLIEKIKRDKPLACALFVMALVTATMAIMACVAVTIVGHLMWLALTVPVSILCSGVAAWAGYLLG